MAANAEASVRKFEETVSRSVLLDDVAPSVTVSTIRTALGQFGNVLSVQILHDPLSPKLASKRALVEMATQREASHAIKGIQERPFIMMTAVCRPVIARPAEATFFPERPSKMRKTLSDDGVEKHAEMGQKPSFCWVERGDPDWDFVNKQKQLAKKHAMECQYLMQELRKEEEELGKEQNKRATSFMDKLALIDHCMNEKMVGQLRRHYGLRVNGQRSEKGWKDWK